MSSFRLGAPNRRSEYYPRFSEAEFERRRSEVRDLGDDLDLDAVLVYGDSGFRQSKIHYLTNYRPPFATYFVLFEDPDEDSTLFVGISNHVQYAREVSVIEDVRPVLPDTPSNVVERLREANVGGGRIGIASGDPRYNLSIPHDHYRMLDDELDADLVDVTAAYTRLISVASDEELERVERAATILDEAMERLEGAIEPGVTERKLAGVLREACTEAGGSLGATFVSSAPMEGAEPGEPLPWKQPSSRTVEHGDIVTTEISAGYRGYKSQIHRPYAVGRELTATYEDIYDVTRETYERTIDALRPGNTARDVYDAMEPLEESRYKHYDVMVHGYGGGYRHPFVGAEESNYWPGTEDPLTATWTFEPGMVVVIQPNVFTEDERAGIQFGTTVIVRDDGPEVLQSYSPEFLRV